MLQNIKRYTQLEITNNSNSILIYGRRKLGKTFFVKNELKYDNYFFIGKNNVVFHNNEELAYDSFFELFKVISNDKIIAIDEFHRLPEKFLDYIHANKPKKIILLTSTLWLATKMLENKDSSLLGIVTPIKFKTISEIDIIKNLSKLNLNEIEIIENATYLKEPILTEYYNKNIKTTLTNFLYNQKYYLKNLIGEIFSEEQRQFSKIYEEILSSISQGKNNSTEITSNLFSKKLLDKDNPSLIQKHLEILVNLGLIDKIQVHNKKKFYYILTSPLLDLYFYLNSKYNYTEQEIPIEFVKEIVEIKMPFHIEIFFTNLFSKLKGLKIEKQENPEIDITLTKFKNIEFIAEVKWKKEYKNKDDKINQIFSQINSKEKYIISKTQIKSEIKQLKLKEIIKLCK